MASKIFRLVVRATNGELCTKDFNSIDDLTRQYEQIGIDDCSTDLSLRGMPVFRGLVGPIPETKSIARYESPEVFEMLTKEWSNIKVKRRRRTPSTETSSSTDSGSIIPRPAIISQTLRRSELNSTIEST